MHPVAFAECEQTQDREQQHAQLDHLRLPLPLPLGALGDSAESRPGRAGSPDGTASTVGMSCTLPARTACLKSASAICIPCHVNNSD